MNFDLSIHDKIIYYMWYIWRWHISLLQSLCDKNIAHMKNRNNVHVISFLPNSLTTSTPCIIFQSTLVTSIQVKPLMPKNTILTTQRRSQLVRCNRKVVFEWQHLLYAFLKGHMTTPSDHVTRFPPSNRTWVENRNGSPSFVKDSVSHPFASSRNLTALWILTAGRKRGVRRMGSDSWSCREADDMEKKRTDSFNYQPV